MTKTDRLQIENELMREFRLWYNPENISDVELQNNIEAQEQMIKVFEDSYKEKESEETAIVLVSEIMKLEIWKDILQNRDPKKRPVQLDD